MTATEAQQLSSPNSTLAEALFRFAAPIPAVTRRDQISSNPPDLWALGIAETQIASSCKRGLWQPVIVDHWLSNTIRDIKQSETGRAENGASRAEFQDAEFLAALFVNTPAWQRPVFAVDCLGAPTFERRTDDFYLHLTVDRPGSISWYAVKDGNEDFGDDVVFDRRRLPEPLQKLGL